MIVQASRSLAVRSATMANRQQRRGMMDYLVNYPDKVMETKKIQMKGGTCLGHMNPTWMKQPGDMGVVIFGAALVGFGCVSTAVGHYNMAHGTGKIE